MKKINYRITVNINEKVMKLGFRGRISEEEAKRPIRVQAIFSQRQVDRRFPMEVHIETTDIGPQIHADALIELPYVFLTPPRRKVTVTFALWYDMEEIILDDQPFPVQKKLFARTEAVHQKSLLRFAGLTAALPVLLARAWMAEGKDFQKAKKKVNDFVYRTSGLSYSPRQRNTGYFASCYQRAVRRQSSLTENTVLFLSERLPEEGGNLLRVKEWLEADPDIKVSDFIHTSTVDQLSRGQLKECARKCAGAKVIILEDFYPQLHSLSIRPETTVVQLWHACGAFKTFGYSRLGKGDTAPQSSMNHRNYDLVTVSSERIQNLYAEAFALPASKVKALGVPRTDDLFDWQYKRKKREELFSKYPSLKENRVVLFAPTYRGDGNKDAYYPMEAFDISYFMKHMPEDVICIIKHHPFIKEAVSIPEEFQDRVLDLSATDHINDLMLVSDLMITDYSSSIFEAAILELPVIFYAFDLEDYKASRDFYFDFDQVVPGYVEESLEGLAARTTELLLDVEDGAVSAFAEKTERFRDLFLGALDGHSTERICSYIKAHYLTTSDQISLSESLTNELPGQVFKEEEL